MSAADRLRPALRNDQLTQLLDALTQGESWAGEITVLDDHGTWVPATVTATLTLDSESRESPARATGAGAPVDGDSTIAGLADRRAFAEAVDTALATETGDPGVRSVVLLEIASLDLVNEAFGPEVGRGVIQCCADHLVAWAHPGDLVAGLSDHTFAVWCPHGRDTTEARAYGDLLRHRLDRPSDLRHVGVALQVSAAVAVATAEVTSASDLLQRSRTALLQARPDATTKLYETSMHDELMRRVELEALVSAVIEHGAVDLAYQPVVRLDDQQTVGAEALLRVTDTAGAPVPPDEIVQVAEQSGQMDELGDVIMRTACAAAATWRRDVPDRWIQLAVNLSARQLEDPTLPRRVADALDESGLDASSLWLEITESTLMRNPARSTALLADLKARGVRLAADDFGTGYSSLAYLKTFPLDALKVDRSFVAALPTGHQEVAITRAVIAVADALGLEVVAEGIERDDQRDCIASLGAALGQGHLWSRALTAEAFSTRLAAETEAARSPRTATSTAPIRRSAPSPSTSPADEHLDAILEVLAHEIRNPLAVVRGYAGLIETNELADTRLGGAAIQRAATRIDDIIGQLASVSHRGGRSQPVVRAPIAIGATVDRIVEQFQVVSTVDLRVVERPDPTTTVAVDATQIEQAITNLISNAIRFSPSGASVEVAVHADRRWVDIEVSDHGPGVDPIDLASIFRKYGHADPGGPGSGLGLYVARRMTRAHGGDIFARPRTDAQGTTFTLRLPRTHDLHREP